MRVSRTIGQDWTFRFVGNRYRAEIAAGTLVMIELSDSGKDDLPLYAGHTTAEPIGYARKLVA